MGRLSTPLTMSALSKEALVSKIQVSYPFILLTAALLALDVDSFFLLVWSAVVIHEGGHLLAIRLARCGVDRVQVRLSGLKIEYSSRRQTSYTVDAFIALGGPVANLLVAAVLAGASRFYAEDNLYILVGAHVILAVFNLLPAMPMDGGRIALAALSHGLGPERALSMVQSVTGGLGAVLTAGGLWALLVSGGVSFVPMLTGLAILAGSLGMGGNVRRPAW